MLDRLGVLVQTAALEIEVVRLLGVLEVRPTRFERAHDVVAERTHLEVEHELARRRLEDAALALREHALPIGDDTELAQRTDHPRQARAQSVDGLADVLQRHAAVEQALGHPEPDEILERVEAPPAGASRRLQEPRAVPVPEPARRHAEDARDLFDAVEVGHRVVVTLSTGGRPAGVGSGGRFSRLGGLRTAALDVPVLAKRDVDDVVALVGHRNRTSPRGGLGAPHDALVHPRQSLFAEDTLNGTSRSTSRRSLPFRSSTRVSTLAVPSF